MHLSTVAADRLLVITVSGNHREEVLTCLEGVGYDVHDVESIEQALPVLRQGSAFPIVLIVACDCSDRMRAAYDDLVEGIRAIGRASASSQIVLAVDSSIDIATCCQAVSSGLCGFVEIERGRIDRDALIARLQQARRRYERALADARKLHSGEIFEKTGIVGCSRAMAELLSHVARAAEVSDAPVLIYGESGTGKQLVAEMIHRLDQKRSARPFLSVNCAAITGTLAESALFGHVKGAFTGATEPRKGYFRAADGGSIFLDEIGELSLDLQPKLLRFLQERLVMPVGSDLEYSVDLRVIAAANRRIPVLVEEGKFRMDLFQRLNVITLDLPPLRERREDIPPLVDFFVKKYAAYYGKPITAVDRRVYELLSRSALQGNVRELENAIRRSMAMKTDGDQLVLSDLPPALLESHAAAGTPKSEVLTTAVVENACALITSGAMTLPEFIEECERLVLAHSINDYGESHVDLSRLMGLSTRTMYNKRRKYRL